MSVDTTYIRKQIAQARAGRVITEAVAAVLEAPSVSLEIHAVEAVLAELDQLRLEKRSRILWPPRPAAGETEIELPSSQDALIGRAVTVAEPALDDPALLVPDMDFLCTIQEALSELMMKDARGNRPYALLEWCSDNRKTAAWAIITAIQEQRIPGLCVSVDPGFWGRACAKLTTERDSLKRENLDLRSRTVFPKAALAAKLAVTVRAWMGPGTPSEVVNMLHAYEKEDAEYPFVPADCDVRRVVINVVPGPEGEGVEIYATSVKQVEEKMGELGEQLEDAKSALQRKMSIAEARKICEGGHDFGAEKEHREKLKSGVILCINLRWPWGVHWEDGVTDKHFGSEEGALLSIADIKEADSKKLSARPCTRCGERHKLDEFPQDSRVFVVDSESPLFGWAGYMHSWSQYGCPITYTLTFGENKKQFDPCQLRATP